MAEILDRADPVPSGIVVSLIGIAPPPRWNGAPWTRVLVEEAPAIEGPWVTIDNQALTAPDSDPTAPAARNVTTNLATLDIGWYHLVFVDGDGGRSGPLGLVRNSVRDSPLPPSPDEVRQESPLLRVKFPDSSTVAQLRAIVYQATALVEAITWRDIDPTTTDPAPEGYASEAVPSGLIPVAFQAITRMAERIYVTTEPTFAEQVATGRRLRGFSAGPYSENYFAPGEFARRGAQQGRPPVDPDDALDTALWALMTEDARDYFVWRSTGVAPPVGVATAFDYRRQNTGYAAGSLGFPGGGYGRGGPDGF